ncbi:unnamed protein product [Vicia faba]|uniref:Uncharacterized protein n=1 Tax=Vicia faba TaxID=3906 RepID=A0AAV0YEC9_VICFA|nr:unnamed protein product [Vicia faba]
MFGFFFLLELAWQCTPGKEVAWNMLSLFTASCMLYLKRSFMDLLLNNGYMNDMETLVHTSTVLEIVVYVDILLKVTLAFVYKYILLSFNKLTRGHPHNEKVWIAFAEFQDKVAIFDTRIFRTITVKLFGKSGF